MQTLASLEGSAKQPDQSTPSNRRTVNVAQKYPLCSIGAIYAFWKTYGGLKGCKPGGTAKPFELCGKDLSGS